MSSKSDEENRDLHYTLISEVNASIVPCNNWEVTHILPGLSKCFVVADKIKAEVVGSEGQNLIILIVAFSTQSCTCKW